MSAPLSLGTRDVSRAYAGRTVVDGATIDLRPGKITALLGGSGAGKSTLLRLIAGLEPVDSGEVRYGGKILSSTEVHTAPENRSIGMIFQDFALFPHLDARRNVEFGLSHLPKAERKEIAARWLSKLGLDHRIDAYPHQLSGGEQQRPRARGKAGRDPHGRALFRPRPEPARGCARSRARCDL